MELNGQIVMQDIKIEEMTKKIKDFEDQDD